MKSICELPDCSRFPAKLTGFIAFGLSSSFCYLLKSITSSL